MKKFLLFLFLLPTVVFGTKTTVSSLATLTSTFSAAVGGDTIVIANGTYNWDQIFINNTNNTSTSNWIVVKAQTTLGVVFTGTTYIGFSGNRIHIDGFKFANGNASTNPVVGFRTSSNNLANYSQVSNIYFDNYNTDSITENEWVALYGVRNRVDHCSFINKSNAKASVVVWYSTATFPAQSTSTYHLIDSNYFFHRSYLGGNGGETIRVGVGNNSRTYGYNIIEHNLFEDCIQTEPELVSNKSAYNTYRYNTFKNCNGGLTLRIGKYCSVYSNFFINDDPNKTESYGIRIIDKGHKVYNNYCEGLLGSSGSLTAMRCPIIIYNGTYPTSDSLNPITLTGVYSPADDALVAFNTIVNCKGGPGINIGYYDGGAALNVPTNVSIANNLIKMTTGQAAYKNPVNTALTYFAEGNMYNAPNGLGLISTTGFANTALTFGSRASGILPSPSVVQAAAVNTPNYRTLLSSLDIQNKTRTATFSVGSSEVNGTGAVTNYPVDSTLVGAGKPVISSGRKFYFSSSTGNDSYSITQAQSQSTPWQTLQKLQNLVVGNTVCFAPGDTICFKRGDVFANGYTRFSTPNYYTYASCSWSNDPTQGWTAPSGTPTNPIVFTSYGSTTLPLPNFYYPLAETPITNNSYNVFYFSGVHDIIIDGLQFDDKRFPVQDKANPAYTRTAIIFGEWTQSKLVNGVVVYGSNRDTNMRKYMVTDCIIKNCYFSNVSFAVTNAGINCKFQNNTITNLKSTVDTTGFTDIGSGAFEGLYGFNNEFSNNYIKGAWSRTGLVSDGNGLMGVAFDIFCLKNSKFINNTIIDCSGTWEIGNTDRYDTLSGAWYDTFAFNKSINCGQFGYIHGSPGDVFSGNNRNIGCFNNVIINNNSSRMSGPNFGWDVYGDGQSFRGNLAGQYAWWFFRSPTKCPSNFFETGSVTNGSTTVIIPTTGIQIGSRLYDANENGAYKQVTAIGSGQVTVASPFTVTNSSYSFNIYAPLSDQSWSYPINPPYCNWSGHRYVVQYASDNIRGNADTLVDLRNNIIYATTGDQFIYDASRTKQKHRNNIYYIKGAFLNPTSLGGTLGVGEFNTTTKLFVDTSNVLVDNWNLNLASGSLGINAGIAIPGLTKDFEGVNLTNPPSIGLYNYSAPTSVATPPTVTTASAIVGSATSVTLGGNVTADGGATVYRRGVVYSTSTTVDSTSITGGGKLIVTSTGVGAYTIPIGTLVRGTVYYARAFALNSAGVSYGGEVSFTTLNIPTIATVGATAVTQTTAVSGGTISTDGNSAIIKRGLIYSTSAITDTSNGTKIINATASTGAFSTNLSGLVSNTLYHVKAFAYNAIGIAYGSDLTFTTAAQIISPIVVSNTATTIACNGDSSTVVVSASGGTPPYTGTGTFKRVVGTYTFTVTDGYTNSGSKVVTITQPTLIVATVTFTPVTIIGGTTTVTAASTGGTGTRLHAIDGGAYQSSGVFTGITAGAHTLSVTDGNACIVSKAFTVNTTTQATKSALKFKN